MDGANELGAVDLLVGGGAGFIANPMTPCVLRVQVTQQVIAQLPAEVSVPATLQAVEGSEPGD